MFSGGAKREPKKNLEGLTCQKLSKLTRQKLSAPGGGLCETKLLPRQLRYTIPQKAKKANFQNFGEAKLRKKHKFWSKKPPFLIHLLSISLLSGGASGGANFGQWGVLAPFSPSVEPPLRDRTPHPLLCGVLFLWGVIPRFSPPIEPPLRERISHPLLTLGRQQLRRVLSLQLLNLALMVLLQLRPVRLHQGLEALRHSTGPAASTAATARLDGFQRRQLNKT